MCGCTTRLPPVRGRILVREAGTEPVRRVMVEAPEDAVCRECVAQVAEIIRAQGHAV